MKIPIAQALVTAKIENFFDIERCVRGLLPADKVRSVEVINAMVCAGTFGLLMPKRLIAQLGLRYFCTRQERGLGGTIAIPTYEVARLTIQERVCSLDVGEISDDLPVLMGQISVQMLDFVVDRENRRLIGNPEHGGEEMMDVF